MSTEGSPRDAVVVVTADSHVGPPLDDFRQYCESEHLDDFDAYVLQANEETEAYRWDAENAALLQSYGGDKDALSRQLRGLLRNTAATGGLHDMERRLADLDHDGIAGEVIFHGTPDPKGVFWPMPFESINPLAPGASSRDRELAAAGRRMYNRWLADFCSIAPERHAGLCQIPVWDIDAAVKEVRRAAELGLRGVNFPSPQESLPPYEDPEWDRLFSVCAELRMPLVTHVGGGQFGPMYAGPASTAIMVVESIAVSGRNLWHLIFSGTFDRHPDLDLVITEVPGTWFASAIRDMESIYSEELYFAGEPLRRFLKHRPRDYIMSNVYFACSFMSRPEAHATVELELTERVMWGSDYPHPEGTWEYGGDGNTQPSVTQLSLANTFAGLPDAAVRRMVGENAIDCYGLDAKALASTAERIGPSLTELTSEPDLSLVPESYVGLGFRKGTGPWT